jgi:peptide/nickel transport system substrate-binding protein
LEFNNSNADSPIHDLRVRQAMGYAIDYQGLLDEVLGGAADRVYGPLPSSNWAFAPDSVKRAFIFDPGRAKRLLAEAGYKPGQLKFTLYTFQGSLWRSVATFIQGNLADVGITVTVEQTEFPNFRALHTAGKFEIALDGRAPWYNDPDAHVTIGYLSRLAGTAMTFRMPKDDDLDGRILAAQSAIDPKMRRTLYIDLQQRLMDRVPAIYLFSSKVIIFARANVKGLIANNAPPLSEYWGVSKQ